MNLVGACAGRLDQVSYSLFETERLAKLLAAWAREISTALFAARGLFFTASARILTSGSARRPARPSCLDGGHGRIVSLASRLTKWPQTKVAAIAPRETRISVRLNTITMQPKGRLSILFVYKRSNRVLASSLLQLLQNGTYLSRGAT